MERTRETISVICKARGSHRRYPFISLLVGVAALIALAAGAAVSTSCCSYCS
jgi:hypothetical protein